MHLFVLEGLQKHAIKLVWESMQPEEGSGELYRGSLLSSEACSVNVDVVAFDVWYTCFSLAAIIHSSFV